MAYKEYKIIQDPLNGPIKVSNDFQKLIDSPEFQRLRYIRNLGMCYLVFPGANHTRFEHALGTMHLAQLFSEALEIEEKEILMAAALLHDVGHPPLSHSIEKEFETTTGMDHLEAGIAMIGGKGPFQDSTLPGILEKIGLDPSDIISILKGDEPKFKILSRIVSGPIDVDELDYLRRDSLYCGVSIGNIDHRRIINVALKHNNDVMIEEKGLATLESILIARILMYGSVYFHKTARIAQTMVSYFVQNHREMFASPFRMDDVDLFHILKKSSDDRIAKAIIERRLFKPVLRVPYTHNRYSEILEQLGGLPHIDDTDYIVDVIPPLDFSGTGRIKSDLKVLKPDGVTEITEVSPLIRTLRETLDNKVILVSAAQWAIESIRNALSH